MSILAAAAGIAGSLYDGRINTRNVHQQMDFSRDESERARQWQSEQAEIDRSMQREFAENGIRMRVKDAVAAGLHPLVGAGVNPVSYSPVSVGTSPGSTPGYHASTMGQDISRALTAVQTSEEREADRLKMQLLRSQINETDMRTWGLWNEIERKNKDAQNPPGPTLAPDTKGVIETVPVKIESRDAEDPSRVAGKHPAWQRTELWPGTFWDLPRSQGESPFESMEGIVPQALTLYKNAWINDYKNRTFFKWLREMGGLYRSKTRAFKNTFK